jgi:hypothetical protein
MSSKRKRSQLAADKLESVIETVNPSTSHAELLKIVEQVQALIAAAKQYNKVGISSILESLH